MDSDASTLWSPLFIESKAIKINNSDGHVDLLDNLKNLILIAGRGGSDRYTTGMKCSKQ